MAKVKIFSLRIPSQLHTRLVKLAKAEGRSLNAQLLYLAQKAVENSEMGGQAKKEREG